MLFLAGFPAGFAFLAGFFAALAVFLAGFTGRAGFSLRVDLGPLPFGAAFAFAGFTAAFFATLA